MAFFLALVSIALVLPVILKPFNFLLDDSYFYLQVAYNFSRGNGLTFNQIYSTNGFHPLWEAVCCFIFLVTGSDKSVASRLLLLVAAAQSFLGCLFIHKLISVSNRIAAFVVSSLLLVILLNGMYGSEAHLNSLILSLLLFWLARKPIDCSPFYCLVLSFLAAGSILARLDNVFIVFSLLLHYAIRTLIPFRRTEAIKLAATFLAVFTLLAPYLLFNYTSTAHLVPVSGAVKSTLPNVHFDPRSLGTTGLVVSFAAIVGLFLPVVSSRRGLMTIVRPLSLGVLVHALYTACATVGTDWRWYFIPGIINLILLLAQVCEIVMSLLVSGCPRLTRSLPNVATALVAVIVTTGCARVWQKYHVYGAVGANPFHITSRGLTESWQRVLIARMLQLGVNPEARVFVFDGPGVLAFYSEFKVLPADGLICNYTYDEDLRRMGVLDLLQEKKIDYYVGPEGVTTIGLLDKRLFGTQEVLNLLTEARLSLRLGTLNVPVFSPISKRYVGSLRLPLSREVTVYEVPGHSRIGVWQLGVDESVESSAFGSAR